MRLMAVPSIVLANEYTSVHSKAWIVPKKKPELQRERIAKGPCSIKMRDEKHKIVRRTFDSPEEALKGIQQDTAKKVEQYRMPGQDAFTNVEKRYTNGMWSHELAKRICKLNSNLFVEDSLNAPGCAGFYRMVGTEKIAAGKPNASFRHGFMPEASIIKEDTAGLAVEFIYGWRQVLIRLRRSGDLTAGQFQRLWGVVDYSDERAKCFASDLGEFRI